MATHPKTKKQFLVVEGDRAANVAFRRKLQRIDFDAEGCFDGEQALARMNEKTYDGILLDLDLMMPIKDGLAVLARRGLTKNALTPVYALTTLGEEKYQLARELGARLTFIASEMSVAEVMEAIQKDQAAEKR